MANLELRSAIGRIAVGCLGAGRLLASGLPTGVRGLDLWTDGRYGSVLFWVDREVDISGFGHAILLHHNAKLQDGEWRSTGSGGMGSYEPEQILRGLRPGLHRLGSGTQDPMRVTIGIGTCDVSAIQLRNENGTRARPLGADGFFLLGITFQDPITYAYAIDDTGEELPGEPLLL
jgi:hypothetical protein